ncbi:MAG: hypothetical protein ACJAYG_001548 [Oceanicoccus sp.]|jgi:hypothetical protein
MKSGIFNIGVLAVSNALAFAITPMDGLGNNADSTNGGRHGGGGVSCHSDDAGYWSQIRIVGLYVAGLFGGFVGQS